MGVFHRRAQSSPQPAIPAHDALAPRHALPDHLLDGDRDGDVDVGFAPPVPTDDSADDSCDDQLPPALELGPDAAAGGPGPDRLLRRRRRRAASSSLVDAQAAAQRLLASQSQRLDYLDLQTSLPLALASVRDRVLVQLTALEERLRSFSLAIDGTKVDVSKAALSAHLLAAQQQLHLLLARLPDMPGDLGDLSVKLPSVPQGVQALPNRLLTDASAALASLKTHLDAATEAVSGEWSHDLEAIRACTAHATKILEDRISDWGSGARDAVCRAKGQAEELEMRLYEAALELASEGRRLITYADLPLLWRNNEYILTGYRFIPVRRWPKLVQSTFEWHNETLNVWTHIIGIALVALAPWIFAPSDASSDLPGAATTPMDKVISWVYLGAAIECMAFSVSWHVMAGCSDFHYFNLFACVDYTGIGWLISASVWTVVYNLFYQQPNIIWAYVTITFVLAVVCTVVPFIPWFNERRNKGYRIALFVALAGFAVLPVAHAAYAHGLLNTLSFLAPISLSILTYVAGLLFYATHFPESCFPGTFDYVAHAHQIWHTAIVLAVLLHYRCVQNWHTHRAAFADPTAHASPGPRLPFLPSYQDNEALLTIPDAAVYAFRQTLGSLAGGAVGRGYSTLVSWVSERLS